MPETTMHKRYWRKQLVQYLPVLGFIILITTCQKYEDTPNWKLETDALNVAVLVFVDSLKSFEGAALFSDPAYRWDLGDSLILSLTYSNAVPVDGPLILRLESPAAGDTILDYWYNPWFDQGKLRQPAALLDKNDFAWRDSSASEPFYAETLESGWYSPVDSAFTAQRDTVWQRAKRLDITHAFAQYDYQVFTCLLSVDHQMKWYFILCAVIG